MLKFLATRRFNYVDITAFSMLITGMQSGDAITGVIVFLFLIVVSVILGQKIQV